MALSMLRAYPCDGGRTMAAPVTRAPIGRAAGGVPRQSTVGSRPRLATARRRYRRRRLAVLLLLIVAAGLVGLDLARGGGRGASAGQVAPAGQAAGQAPAGQAVATGRGPAAHAVPSAPPASPVPGNLPVGFPPDGPGTFGYADEPGPVLGAVGTLRRFRVAVEDGLGDPLDFAGAIDGILGDERSWIAGGQLRLQRVPRSAPGAEFTIYLATPATSERMCATGGLKTDGYTSCRLSGRVIINVARWLTAVPFYGAPRSEYQAYAINHEVGHQLGYGHETCPGPGRPAPVMQQQTLGLRGCTAYGWPFLDDHRYAGVRVS